MTMRFSRLLTLATPPLFVLLWSTGFLGAKLGLPYAEPFTLLALRMALVSVVLIGAALLFRVPWPNDWRQAGHIVVAGLLVHAVYLGGVFCGISSGVSAGVAALIVGMQPLLTAAIARSLLGEAVSRQQWLGLGLGLVGVAMVVWHKVGGAAPDVLPLLPVLAALVGITCGTLYQRRFCSNINLITGTSLQYLASGVVFALLAVSRETMRITWTHSFIFALVWLAMVLSVGAVFLLYVMIRQGQAARVTSLFYLTPPTTAVFAWLLFDENLSPLALGGFGVAAVGVVLARR